MSFKILEQNGVENEVVDGGALNNFCAGNRDGIIAGVLSECALSAAGNGVAISPGLLIICGVRIKITAAETLYVSSVPLRATRYQIIAQVTLGADGNTSAEFFLQSNASLKRDAIYAQGYGTYQAKIGSFTHNPDGSISDMVRTLDVLYGGGNGGANIEVGNVVTQTLPAGQDAEFDMTARNENGKTIFDVKALIPRGASGTDDEAVHFTPQTLTEAQKTQARANINALSAAEADIQHVAVDCDHEYEITGYTGHEWNVAVPDHCQVTVTKIQGQTGRLSPNLADEDGTYTVQVSTGQSFIDMSLTDNTRFKGLIEGQTYTVTVYNIPSNLVAQYYQASNFTNYHNIENGLVYTFVYDSSLIPTIRFGGNPVTQETQVTPQIMLVSGTYTADTMPAYQPYNNTLVNSKVKEVLSTGVNLYSGKNDLDWTPGYLENKYPLYLDKGTYSICVYAENPSGVNQYQLQGLDEYGNEVFSTPEVFVNTGFLMEVTVPISKILLYVNTTGHIKVMLNYGSSALPYQPYISDDTFGVDIEMTGFGEIDNITKQFTEYGSEKVYTLNGSEPWYLFTGSIHRYRVNLAGLGITNCAYVPSEVNIKSNFIDKSGDYTWGEQTGISLAYDHIEIWQPAYSTVEDFKAWLAANPIQFIYRLATPRIQTTVDIPAGYSAHKGGLQQQVIEGDYLPYIITKDYPVSGAAQILKNLEIDRDQGKMLDAIRQGALPVGKLANAITIISGDTKKTFDGSTPVEITASGEVGPPGEQGEPGVPGEAATITIGKIDVGTALPGQPAKVGVKNAGTSTNAILDFVFMIPRGEQGKQGERGEQGVPGNSSLMTVVIMNPVIGGSSYYGRILLTCPVPSTGIPNNGFENLIPALKFTDYQATGIISLDQNALNAKRVYGLRKIVHNGITLYALIDSQTISAVEAGEELTGASAVVFAQL